MTLSITNGFLEIVESGQTRSIGLPLREIKLAGTVTITGQDHEAFTYDSGDFSSPVFTDNSDLYDYFQTNCL